jgi:hypothetical protein
MLGYWNFYSDVVSKSIFFKLSKKSKMPNANDKNSTQGVEQLENKI